MLGRERRLGVVWLVLRAVWWSRVVLYIPQSAREGCEKVTEPEGVDGDPGPGMTGTRPCRHR